MVRAQIGKVDVSKETMDKLCFEKYDRKTPKNITLYKFEIVDSIKMAGRKILQIDMSDKKNNIQRASFLFDMEIDKVVHYLIFCKTETTEKK